MAVTSDNRIGLGMVGGLPVREAVGYTQAAEAAGFSGFWVHETYGLRDAHSYLAAAGLVTSRIHLGAGCMNTYTRNVALLAMTCATLQELTGGRFRLGLGSAAGRLHDLGYEARYTSSSYRETVLACRQLLCGEAVTVDGRVVRLNNMKLQVPVCNVPIYFATQGPKGLALAAELADGELDGPMVPVATLSRHIETLRAHHPQPGFDVASYIFCSIDDDARAARDAARHDRFLLYLLHMNLQYAGLDPEQRSRIAAAVQQGDIDAAAALVSDEVLNDLILCGDRHDVLDGLAPYVATGLNEPILQPLQPSPKAMEQAIAAGKAYLQASLV